MRLTEFICLILREVGLNDPRILHLDPEHRETRKAIIKARTELAKEILDESS